MKVLVWGLGYVGTVTAASLARFGHEVVAIEVNERKVRAFNHGHPLVQEPALQQLVEEGVRSGSLHATTDGRQFVADADISTICVGTPSGADGATELSDLERVAAQIGSGLRNSARYHVVNLRSTVFPGTTRQLLCPLLEKASNKKVGKDFGVVVNPEFLREGSGVADFHDPPYTVVGGLDSRSVDIVAGLYASIAAPVRCLALEEAELVKLVNNAFHTLKVGFANEVGRLCEGVGIDSHKIMDLICEDTKLNISTAYLRPGFAFGGPCLPKDLRALLANAARLGIPVPLLESILPSNRLQIEVVLSRVQELGAKNVGILGLSFKPGTDDLRESPILELVRELLSRDVNVMAFDPDLVPTQLLGANLEFANSRVPDISGILRSRSEELMEHSEVIIVCQKREEFARLVARAKQTQAVLDLVRLTDKPKSLTHARYMGISW